MGRSPKPLSMARGRRSPMVVVSDRPLGEPAVTPLTVRIVG